MRSFVRHPVHRALGVLLACLEVATAADGFESLMPKKDVTEFWIVEEAPAETWQVRNGQIQCKGVPHGFLRSKRSYKNYVLRAEWRFKSEGWVPKPEDEGWPNAGFFINAGEVVKGWPTSLEVQGHFGEIGSLFGVRGGRIKGAKRGVIVKTNRVRFGDWDRYEITHRDGNVKVVLNGHLVNEGTDAYPREGSVCLQSEGWEVWYRNIEIKELK